MIFAIAIPQLFGLGKFRGHNDDVDERRRDAGCWLVQLYQLSGNRCVCVRRGTIQGCGLELGCLFFLPTCSCSLFCSSLLLSRRFFPSQPTDHDTTTHQTTTSRYSVEAQDERPQGIGCVFRYLTHHHHQWHRTVTAIVYRRRQSARYRARSS